MQRVRRLAVSDVKTPVASPCVSSQPEVHSDLRTLNGFKASRALTTQMPISAAESSPAEGLPTPSLVRSVTRRGKALVVRTEPGEARTVGHRLRALNLPGVLAVVAGDDTLVVAPTRFHRLEQLELQLLGA